MAGPGSELPATSQGVSPAPNTRDSSDAEILEIENAIRGHCDRPVSSLLKSVVEQVRSMTHADGAAIALSDPWGVVCRASTGDAPELGSRIHPDSALTRECFESGQVVICADTESDCRVQRRTARTLRLRSAVVVPLQT